MIADNSELLSAVLARIERGDDPFTDPHDCAAFDYVLRFVFDHAPDRFSEMMDREAMALIGAPEEEINTALQKLAREIRSIFIQMPMKEATAFALSLAIARVLRERAAAFLANGVGHA
jgi:hypothetical protein